MTLLGPGRKKREGRGQLLAAGASLSLSLCLSLSLYPSLQPKGLLLHAASASTCYNKCTIAMQREEEWQVEGAAWMALALQSC